MVEEGSGGSLKYYALKTNAPCKCCGKNFGFMTWKHKIILATDEDVYILNGFTIKYPSTNVVEIEKSKVDSRFILLSIILTSRCNLDWLKKDGKN